MKKKKNVKKQVDTDTLKKLLAKLPKDKNYIKSATLITLSLLFMIGIFNYTNINKYFGLNNIISKAKVINIYPPQPLIPFFDAAEDTVRDVDGNGLVYHHMINSIFNSDSIRYYSFNEPTAIVIDDAGDIYGAVRISNDIVTYNVHKRVYWNDVGINPYDKHEIPYEIGDIDMFPDVWGSKIVWIRTSNGTDTIWEYNIFTNEIFQLVNVNSNKKDLRYHFDKIVWADDRNGNWDIYSYNLSTQSETQITTDLKDQYEPTVYDNIIIWTDTRNDLSGNYYDSGDIYMHDVTTGTETQITDNPRAQNQPDIFNNKIAWSDYRNQIGDPNPLTHVGNSDIYMYDLVEKEEKVISNKDEDQVGPKIYQNTIYWTYSYGWTPSNLPNIDIQKTTFDEIVLLSPAEEIDFKFEDVLFAWQFNSDVIPVTNFWIKVLLDGNNPPFLPTGELFAGHLTSLPLESDRMEYMPDGLYEWGIAPEINNEHTPYYSNLRNINKKTAADLVTPSNGKNLEVNELFDWENVDGAINYVARVTGLLPDNKPYYFPLNSVESDFILVEPLYNILFNKPGIEYTWAVTGTALGELLSGNINDPEYQKLTHLYFGETRTFTVD